MQQVGTVGATDERIVFQANGLELVGDAMGAEDRPTLLFLHGGGQTRKSWRGAVAEAARRGYRGIALDLRGHGESGWAPDGRYAIDAFVEDILAVIAALPSKPVLVGASIGGVIGMLLGGEHPQALSGLILVDAAPRGESAGMQEIGAFMNGNPEGFASLEEAAEAVSAYLPHRQKPSNPAGLMKNLRQLENGRFVWHWDPNFLRRNGGPGLDIDRMEDAVKKLTIPTMLIRGRLSRVVSKEGAQLFLDIAPHAEFVDVAGADHMVAGDDNDAFNDAIFNFLGRHVPATGAGQV